MGKYIIAGVSLILLLICMTPLMVNHTNNTMSAERVTGALETATLGAMRNDPEHYRLDMEDTIATVTANVLKSQTNTDRDIEISYVFFDKNNNVTNNKDAMTGVQYRVKLLDKKGKVQSETEKKLILKEVKA
ncbi:hypothetical protein [Bacillus paranthracis]|uniref:hypothetical protein n=1 Tax=Bacillus paranthracis TaxID=2026186 RepID=UPI0018791987|nr:hypothetical protein [Bacillus paranthracis]MBE7114629.1 hypothetical protein [Bacillus paranthracis]